MGVYWRWVGEIGARCSSTRWAPKPKPWGIRRRNAVREFHGAADTANCRAKRASQPLPRSHPERFRRKRIDVRFFLYLKPNLAVRSDRERKLGKPGLQKHAIGRRSRRCLSKKMFQDATPRAGNRIFNAVGHDSGIIFFGRKKMTIGLYFRQKVCAFGYALPKHVDALICPAVS